MRISRIEIDRYGCYERQTFTESMFDHPFTVVFGRNEAGKSTLHAFLYDMLFGRVLSPDYRSNADHERHGGRIVLRDRTSETYILERVSPPKAATRQCRTVDGAEISPRYMQQLLGNISGNVYRHIFAFRHEELQHLNTLHNDEVSAYLYSAAMGTGSFSLLAAERKMNQEADRLYRPKATQRPFNQLLSTVEERQRTLQKMSRKQDEYFRLAKEGDQYEAQMKAGTAQLAHMQEQRNHVQEMRRLLERCEHESEELSRLEEELEQIRGDLQDIADRMGSGWPVAHIAQLAYSLPDRESTVHAGEQIRELEGKIDNEEEKLRELEQRQAWLEAEASGEHTRRLAEAPPVYAREKRAFAGSLSGIWWLFCGMGVIIVGGLLWLSDNVAAGVWVGSGYVLMLICLYLYERNRQRDLQAQWSWQDKQVGQTLGQQVAMDHLEQEQRKVHIAFEQKQLHVREMHHTLSQMKQAWAAKLEDQGLPVQLSVDALGRLYRLIEDAHVQLQKEKRVQEEQSARRAKMAQIMRDIQELENRVPNDWAQSFEADHVQWQPVDQASAADRGRFKKGCERCEWLLHKLDEREKKVRHTTETIARQIGETEERLKQLLDEPSWGLTEQLMAEDRQEMQDMAQRWSAYKLAAYICRSTRRIYEEERQPEVLRKAGKWLEKATGGAYHRIIAPLDQDDLYVVTSLGQRISTRRLSRGTLEMLYVIMRFALIEDYQQYAALPVLMDDPFVHFDRDRLQEVLRLCVQLSRVNQVILFTCHDHVVQSIRDISPRTNIVYLESMIRNKKETGK